MTKNNFQKIIPVFRQLTKQGVHDVDFKDRKTTFYCGHNALEVFIKNNKVFKTFSDENIKHTLVDEGLILSVGRTKQHDMARLDSFNCGINYATCPLPLSNDSFLSDRYNGSTDKAALIMHFPRVVILDWKLCQSKGIAENLPGVGEVAGLVTSVYDYFITHGEDNFTPFWHEIKKIVNDLFDIWESNTSDEFRIIHLGAALSFKGMLMRTCGDNSIGASCDHMISYFLQESGFQLPHGVLVFMGMLISLLVINEDLFDYYFKFGKEIGLIQNKDMMKLLELDFCDLFRNSASLRPNRKTILRDISRDDAYIIGEKFKRRLSHAGLL
ncbi:MAG: glycerol-phosphate dehydrogenase [Acidobacteriota bacterium]|nr:glycerol-phosphate dehydrogenase [Acidobacteriota bacterium]